MKRGAPKFNRTIVVWQLLIYNDCTILQFYICTAYKPLAICIVPTALLNLKFSFYPQVKTWGNNIFRA